MDEDYAAEPSVQEGEGLVGIPVRRVRREEREQRRMVSGVRACARAPTRSAKPPRPVRVL